MVVRPSIDEALASAEQRFRAAGVPMTIQRRTILRSLVGRVDHPTADELFEGVREHLPGVSRATLYRTLDALVEIGSARRVSHPGAVARFDGNTQRHDHLLCLRCGELRDVPTFSAVKDPSEWPRFDEFDVTEATVVFQGRCVRCATEGDASR